MENLGNYPLKASADFTSVELAQSHLVKRRREWDWAQRASEAFMLDAQESNFCAALQGLRLGMLTDEDFAAHRVVCAHSLEIPHTVQDAP